MKRLLDVSTLLAALLKRHPDHLRVISWLKGVRPVLCPITQLGWTRIASNTFGLDVEEALRVLREFERTAEFIPCDLPLTKGLPAPTSAKTTDWYLADLAAKHGMKWATLDQGARHPAAELVAT